MEGTISESVPIILSYFKKPIREFMIIGSFAGTPRLLQRRGIPLRGIRKPFRDSKTYGNLAVGFSARNSSSGKQVLEGRWRFLAQITDISPLINCVIGLNASVYPRPGQNKMSKYYRKALRERTHLPRDIPKWKIILVRDIVPFRRLLGDMLLEADPEAGIFTSVLGQNWRDWPHFHKMYFWFRAGLPHEISLAGWQAQENYLRDCFPFGRTESPPSWRMESPAEILESAQNTRMRSHALNWLIRILTIRFEFLVYERSSASSHFRSIFNHAFSVLDPKWQGPFFFSEVVRSLPYFLTLERLIKRKNNPKHGLNDADLVEEEEAWAEFREELENYVFHFLCRLKDPKSLDQEGLFFLFIKRSKVKK